MATSTTTTDQDRYTDYPVRRKLTPAERRALPPGPRSKGLSKITELLQLSKTITKKSEQAVKYGKIASYEIGPHLVFQVNHPDLVKEVFVDNYRHMRRGRFEEVRWALGDSVLLANQPHHMRQRHLMQPEFNRVRVAMYSERVTETVNRHLDRWRDGQHINLLMAMGGIGTDTTARALMGLDVHDRTDEIVGDFHEIQGYVYMRAAQYPFWSRLAHKLPLPNSRRFKGSVNKMDRMLYGLIKERQESRRIHDDFMSVMVQQQRVAADQTVDIYDMMAAERRTGAAGDAGQCPVAHNGAATPARDTNAHANNFLTDKLLRDEAATVLFAGQESFHITMAWLCYYLSIDMDMQDRLHQELDEVLEGRPVDLADFPRLEFLNNLVSEVMRRRSPVSAVLRLTAQDINVGGYLIPEGTVVASPLGVLHTHPEFYDDPERFDPDRWTPEFRRNLHRFAYLPFGIGSNRCIGEDFAWLMMRTVIATMCQKWRLHPDPKYKLEVESMFTTQPKGGMPMYLERRA